MPGYFETRIEFIKGVGPQKAALLNKELQIFTFGDLIQYYPFRYEDRTKFYQVKDLPHLNIHDTNAPNLQLKGRIQHFSQQGGGRKKRLTANFTDGTGTVELIWFQGVNWVLKKVQPGVDYILFGKPSIFNGRINFAHPELEVLTSSNEKRQFLQPVYSVTERLRNNYLDSKGISKILLTLLQNALPHVKENLPDYLTGQFKLMDKQPSMLHIHFPSDPTTLQKARFRLKFEELFYVQLRLLTLKIARTDRFRGQVFKDTGLVNKFYNDHLPFDLTSAQKNVIKEIYRDLRSGNQMNRLLQGDVGSGKTVVAFISMLLVIGSGAQTALMAPTEILAEQHFRNLQKFTHLLGLDIVLLTGSTKKKQRDDLHRKLQDGTANIIVGTHALLEDKVKFNNLGMAVVDEQHRFGVAQRAKLWQKNRDHYPHVLVMTATPIPRTLAMTLYGDLDVSVIDELPKGRKPIKTTHRYDAHRLRVFEFLRQEIKKGRQVYIVYPLIEESEKMDLKNLEDGYESIQRAFPDTSLSLLHGRMKSDDKEFEMQRFLKGETKIMISTTVIEVGVDVPNASVMVIENAERFGLSQLHQLRGRVGRGAEQSYCILMTGYKLSKEGKARIETMVRTNNGFEIAETDLKLRGPGDLMGTQQSGIVDLMISDLARDVKIIELARQAAQEVLKEDPQLKLEKNTNIRKHLDTVKKNVINWSKIS